MRGKLILAAILVQILILGWMAGEREWIVRASPEVWLRTAPVDPRDLFRGDYVTLGYDISTIPADKFGPGLKEHLGKHAGKLHRRSGREMVIYVSLKTNPDTGLAAVSAADLTPPESGMFIKGRARPFDSTSTTPLTGVTYGIEAYFIQQGRGREFERRSPEGMPDDVQTPMEMRVAIGRNGTAVLTGHRRNELGIGTIIETTRSDQSKAGSRMIRVTIRNTGAEARAVVLPADHRTLRVQRMEGWSSVGLDVGILPSNPPPLTDADVRVLMPGECARIDLDPAECRVRIDAIDEPVSIDSLKNDHQYYRIVYEPPSAEECRGLARADLITRDRLPGPQFSTYEITR